MIMVVKKFILIKIAFVFYYVSHFTLWIDRTPYYKHQGRYYKFIRFVGNKCIKIENYLLDLI